MPDKDIPDDGTEVVQQGILKAKHRLATQLTALGFRPQDITYMAMSHYHADHTANANMFAKSATWIVQQAEYDAMFKADKAAIRSPETYSDLKDAKRIVLNNEDHDVFGDGTVIIKTGAGAHPWAPDAVSPAQAHGAVINGRRSLSSARREVPRPGADVRFRRRHDSRDRRKVEDFVKKNGATEWIQHDPPTYAKAKKAPEFYD